TKAAFDCLYCRCLLGNSEEALGSLNRAFGSAGKGPDLFSGAAGSTRPKSCGRRGGVCVCVCVRMKDVIRKKNRETSLASLSISAKISALFRQIHRAPFITQRLI